MFSLTKWLCLCNFFLFKILNLAVKLLSKKLHSVYFSQWTENCARYLLELRNDASMKCPQERFSGRSHLNYDGMWNGAFWGAPFGWITHAHTLFVQSPISLRFLILLHKIQFAFFTVAKAPAKWLRRSQWYTLFAFLTPILIFSQYLCAKDGKLTTHTEVYSGVGKFSKRKLIKNNFIHIWDTVQFYGFFFKF